MRVEICVQVRGAEQRLRVPGQNLSILELMQIVPANTTFNQSVATEVIPILPLMSRFKQDML